WDERIHGDGRRRWGGDAFDGCPPPLSPLPVTTTREVLLQRTFSFRQPAPLGPRCPQRGRRSACSTTGPPAAGLPSAGSAVMASAGNRAGSTAALRRSDERPWASGWNVPAEIRFGRSAPSSRPTNQTSWNRPVG